MKSKENFKRITINRIILKGIRNKFGEKIYFLSILILISMTAFLSSYILICLNNGINRMIDRIGADIIVVPKGYASEVEDALFSGEACTVYFNKDWLDTLQSIDGVQAVSPQLYIASLSNESCCDMKSQLIAIDYNTDFVIEPWIEDEYTDSLKKNEVIVGSAMNYNVGEEALFLGEKYKVVYKLDESGMGYDRSVFLSYDTANDLLKNPKVEYNFSSANKKAPVSAYYLKVKDVKETEKIKKLIQEEIKDEDIKVFTSDSLTVEIRDTVSKFSGIFNVLKVLLLTIGGIGIIGLYSTNVYNRRREFGILYSIGGKRKQVLLIILGEVLYMGFTAGIIGVLFGEVFVQSFSNYIRSWFGFPFLSPSIIQNIFIIFKCMALVIITSLISATLAIIKINFNDPASLIKES
ncbi:MAG: ABC transporter permease [Clostridiales bacterium]|nr:ABC transporter permease [Clostridiales bacterium]